MQKKPPFINIIITALLALFTVLIGILGGFAPNELPSAVTPHLGFFLLLLGVATVAFVGLTIWQTMRQSASEHDDTVPWSEHRQQLLEKQNHQRMLERVHASWIKGVLEQSLHGAALIALGLKEQQDAVANPWRLVLQEVNQTTRPLPPGTRITQIYDDAGGELLILGEPGSGKTTLLLELTRDLLDRAKKEDALPMPVVFNLSSWAVKRQPLTAWLVEELNTKYQVPRKFGRSWVDRDQVIPLLDGLDEVAKEHRAACVDAINAYRREHMVSIVVCSRSIDYFAQEKRVQIRCAVATQPLTEQQIDNYLWSAGGQLEAVRVALHKDKELQELAEAPLMLSVLTLAYHGKSIEDLLEIGSTETRRKQIFTSYVKRMLERRSNQTSYTAQQTISWLTWLARQLIQHSQTQFYLERMQPDWLPDTRSRSVYRVVAGLVFWLTKEIEPAEIIVWSWQGVLSLLGDGLYIVLTMVLLYGLLFGLLYGLLYGLRFGLVFGLLGGLVGGLLGGLLGGLVGGLEGQRMDQHNIVTPNQGIWRSARNGLRIGLVCWLVLGLVLGLGYGLLGGLVFGLIFGLLFGLIFGLPFGLRFGGNAFIQHFALRWFLWRAGSIPWHYPRFLDYAADRILLRKVGGGYIFVHRLLLEYFASLDTAAKSSGVSEQE